MLPAVSSAAARATMGPGAHDAGCCFGITLQLLTASDRYAGPAKKQTRQRRWSTFAASTVSSPAGHAMTPAVGFLVHNPYNCLEADIIMTCGGGESQQNIKHARSGGEQSTQRAVERPATHSHVYTLRCCKELANDPSLQMSRTVRQNPRRNWLRRVNARSCQCCSWSSF